MADGTTDSGTSTTTSAPSARNIVDLYFKNVNTTASPSDVYQVGNALVNRIDEVDAGVNSNSSSITEIENELKPLPTIEENITEIQDVMAKMIFNLNELGIEFEFEQINNFRDKYLNK